MHITAVTDLHRFLNEAQMIDMQIAHGLRHLAGTAQEPLSTYLKVFAAAAECAADKVGAAGDTTL